jgi:hypothetical protein
MEEYRRPMVAAFPVKFVLLLAILVTEYNHKVCYYRQDILWLSVGVLVIATKGVLYGQGESLCSITAGFMIFTGNALL